MCTPEELLLKKSTKFFIGVKCAIEFLYMQNNATLSLDYNNELYFQCQAVPLNENEMKMRDF